MCSSPAVRKKRVRQENGTDDVGVKEEDVCDLRVFLKKEEAEIRAASRELLNCELIARIESCKALSERAHAQKTFPEALLSGVVGDVRQELSSCFRLGVRLESWINTYQPPLAAGGNVGVSAEVQDGIFQNVHAMTTESGSALHRMLAYEKEHAAMRTKCTDEQVHDDAPIRASSCLLPCLPRLFARRAGDPLPLSSGRWCAGVGAVQGRPRGQSDA